MRQGVAIVSFTDRGASLAERIAAALGGTVSSARSGDFSLGGWTAENFPAREALVFVGAAGIAVRAIAPHFCGKAEDPAVVAVDEGGRFVIPLASGHLGGANDLARKLAALCGGTAVITTATDINGAFAVDLWAKRQGMTVLQPERIKNASAKILAGETILVYSPWPIAGSPPAGVEQTDSAEAVDVLVTLRPTENAALCLVPRVLTLGIGCRRGVSFEQIEAVFSRFCEERGVLPRAIRAAASIDRKAEETGLLAFCEAHGLPMTFYTAEELAAAPGDFSASAFVESTVGVSNVCERSAVLAAGGILWEKKYAANGVTFALALTPPRLDWSF